MNKINAVGNCFLAAFFLLSINERFQQLAQNYVVILDDKPVFDCGEDINSRGLLCKMTMRAHL